MIIEWPDDAPEPSAYWLSNLPEDTCLERLVYLAKQRWLIERDYRELKQELGLGHYEGRGWPGFHHHAALAIAAYGFLLTERLAIPPSAAHQRGLVQAPALPESFRPRGAPNPTRTTPARLDRDVAPKDRHRPGTKADTMSLLSTDHATAANEQQTFVTQ